MHSQEVHYFALNSRKTYQLLYGSNFIILILFINCLNVARPSANSKISMKEVEETMRREKIYPQLINQLPEEIVEISYGGRYIRFGELLKDCNFTNEQPTKVTFTADRNELYVLLMTDPDGPTWNRPRQNEWHHWLLTNIRKNKIEDAECMSEYIGPLAGQGNRLHRYIFMVFQQPPVGDIAFLELNLDTRPVNRLRGYFSSQKYCKKYNLTLKAINYFKVNWGTDPAVGIPTPEIPQKVLNDTDDNFALTMVPFVE